ncbi:unnamed protein product [Dibothriocephalus latus]|uniref:PKD/REJ-like domain-containing protein n=1 Tax=Dibothriocephalus latus TaxID=60516 RepID=A0A3P7KW36_DIBLA|nr:unnamed protein product [Dibothriocephalus latus]
MPQLSADGHHDGATCVSPTNDLILHGTCTGNCDTATAYRWELQIVAHDGEPQNLTTSQLQAAADDYTLPTLIIKASALSELDGSEDLRVCYVAVDLPSRPGVCRLFCLTDPPLLGTCHVNVSGPIPADSYVSISCEGRGNNGGPFVYRFYTKEKAGNFIFHTSSLPSFVGELPHKIGEFAVCVRVIDNYGSYDERCFVKIEFTEESPKHLFDQLHALANGTDDRLARLLADGNFNEISVACQSLATAILQATQTEEAGELHLNIPREKPQHSLSKHAFS